VSGWLLLLSRLLVVGHPLVFAIRALEAINALPIRGVPLAGMLAVNAVVIVVGVAAGRALTLRAPHAVGLTQAALGLSALMETVRYSTSIFPNNRAPGDTPLYVTASLVYHGVWMVYVWRTSGGSARSA
jgi:hypothetical protein